MKRTFMSSLLLNESANGGSSADLIFISGFLQVVIEKCHAGYLE
jgi:hypothetical protein